MSAKTTPKAWNPTKYRGLYKHANGTYYVRVGSKTWRSLKTKVQAVALKRRDEVLIEAENQIANPASIELKGTSMAAAIEVRRWQIYNDASLKSSTRVTASNVLQGLINSWPGLEQREIRDVTRADCEEWVGKQRKKFSASWFNKMLVALKRLLEIGVDAGLIAKNPALHLKRKKPGSKDLLTALPSRSQFKEFVAAIRGGRGRLAGDRGDLVEFLAYSGVRIAEANAVCWKHIDWERSELVVEGDADHEGTKNRKTRRVPMIAELRKLVEKLRANRSGDCREDKLLAVKEASRAMQNAAARIGIEPVSHHDMRHLFATTCIESGVDIPTVAYWLGHTDGGKLALEVYGHLRNEHSKRAAERVRFG